MPGYDRASNHDSTGAGPGAPSTPTWYLPLERASAGHHADQPSWQQHAACRSLGPYFFGPDDEQSGARIRRERTARQICADCPVLAPCRRQGVETAEPYGIWGGLTERDRRDVRKSARGELVLRPRPSRQSRT